MGVLPHSEIDYEDMIKILEKVQMYVPSKDVEREMLVPDQAGASIIQLKDKQCDTSGREPVDCCPNSWCPKDSWQLGKNVLMVSYLLPKTGTQRCVFLK